MKAICEYLINNHLNKHKDSEDMLYLNSDYDTFVTNCKIGRITKDEEFNRQLKSFLKGKEYKTGISIQLNDFYLHIHRYCDMHRIKLTFLLDDNYDWPKDPNRWNNAFVYYELDDRSKLNDLYLLFTEIISDSHKIIYDTSK